MNKRAITMMLAALALVARAETADAESCGGGSSGSSGDSGGSSDSGSSGSSGSTCSDASDVHGYRQCTKYGAWSQATKIPLLFVELGVAVQRFDNPLTEGTGSVSHESERFTYRVSGGGGGNRAAERAVAVVTRLRFGVGSRLGLYGAGELEVGGLAAEPDRQAEMTSSGMYGAPALEERGALAMGALGVVGFQRGMKRMVLGAELLGGVRAVSYDYHSQYLSCEQMTSILVTRGVVEARARAAYFVSPYLSVGAHLGASLIDERDWNVGLSVGGYTRSFAATR